MSYTLLFALLLYSIQISVAKLLPIAESNNNAKHTFANTLLRIYKETPYETIFVLENAGKSCLATNVLESSLKIPLIRATDAAAGEQLRTRFNSNLLTIVCLSQAQMELKLLKMLAASLQYRHQTRIVLHFAEMKPTSALLATTRDFFELNYMTNVIGFYNSTHYYRYSPFPSGNWKLESANTTRFYTPLHQLNLHGKIFNTLPDQILPRSMVYVDASGQQRLSGHVGYLMSTFASKYNLTLKFVHPVTPGNIIHLTVLFDYVNNGTIDLAISLTTASFNPTRVYPLLSYPLEIIEWFVALPCSIPLEYAEIYTIVVTTQVIALLTLLTLLFSALDGIIKYLFHKRNENFSLFNILMNENMFRGVFGLSVLIKRRTVVSSKILYIFLFLLGIFINNMYSAYFQTLFTSPPLQKEILSFDDMRRRNLKLMFDRSEVQLVREALGSQFNETFRNILVLADTATVQSHRSLYDTSYAYTMPESLWAIFSAQQETFERKIYCLAPTLKFFGLLMMGIPVAENSFLLEPLNKMIMRATETGLLLHWQAMTFIDLVATGRFSLKVTGNVVEFHDISLKDIEFPFHLLLIGLCLSSVVFIVEVSAFKLKIFHTKRVLK
ncbi:unnamed protein product [Ceratitis capitata]|uniref:(Mediterranean fruit fly) hypothetical protein n=1 Tax=Ceratitis capitata TaxID=7213 RepID=A0A811VEN9_CERCA|nr:unnamed protein product [Ceratitis capitata]